MMGGYLWAEKHVSTSSFKVAPNLIDLLACMSFSIDHEHGGSVAATRSYLRTGHPGYLRVPHVT